MDTLSPEEVSLAESQGSKVERFPSDKNESDLELAIEAAHTRGAANLSLVGALGGQWDHCLANLLAPLSRCLELGIWARLLTDSAEIYLLSAGSYRVNVPHGTRVSLAGLSSNVLGLNLEGFEYELTEAVLRRSQTRGLANVARSPEARVSLAQGELLLTLVTA